VQQAVTRANQAAALASAVIAEVVAQTRPAPAVNVPVLAAGQEVESRNAASASHVSLVGTREVNTRFAYVVPCAALNLCESRDKPQLQARIPDGGPLPDWLKFDADTGTFHGTAPVGTASLEVQLLPLGTAGVAAPGQAVTLMLRFVAGKTNTPTPTPTPVPQ
jgi:Putative Ig domain